MVNKHDLNENPVFNYATSVDSLATVGSTRHLLGSDKASNIKLYSLSNHAHCPMASQHYQCEDPVHRNGKCDTPRNGNCETHRSGKCEAHRNGNCEAHQNRSCETHRLGSCETSRNGSCETHRNGICASSRNGNCEKKNHATTSKLFQKYIISKHQQQQQTSRHASISYTESSTFSDEMCMQIQEAKTKQSLHGTNIVLCCHAFKNLFVLSISFMLLFTAFISLQTIQSSLHAASYTGVISLSCYYGATLISCFIAPAILTKLSTKWTICLGCVFYIVHIASHFHPELYVLIPSSLVLGAMTGPLWSGQSTYLTTLAISYAQATGQVMEAAISSFNGVFFGFLQTSQVWGNLLSASVLGADNDTVLLNQVNESVLKQACGARDCGLWDEFPSNALPHQLPPVTAATTNILLLLYISLVIVALLLNALFLSKTAIHSSGSLKSISLSSHQLFFTSVRMFNDRRLQLLSPLVVFTGLQQGFVLGDFTKSYVNCALGIHRLGYVMVCFGAVNACCSVVIGNVVKHIQRYPIMISGTLFSVCLFTVLVQWRPHFDDPPMFYVIAACLGLCDAIWQTQTNAMFGVLFKEQPEAAFSCYRMLQCLGFSVAFGLGAVLCVRTKVYMMCGVLAVAMLAYGVVERQLLLLKKHRDSATVVML